MSFLLISDKLCTARKNHRCIWCGEQINQKSLYRRVIGKWEGDLQFHKWHRECHTAFQDELKKAGVHCAEIVPFQNPRPKA